MEIAVEINIQNFTYVIFLFLIIAQFYFAQEYIYHETAVNKNTKVTYVKLYLLHTFCCYETTIFYYIPYYGVRISFIKSKYKGDNFVKTENGIPH